MSDTPKHDSSKRNVPKCKTCRWRNEKGQCENHRLEERGILDLSQGDDRLVYPYSEGGYLLVGPEFGCVHHEKKPSFTRAVEDAVLSASSEMRTLAVESLFVKPSLGDVFMAREKKKKGKK